MGDEAPMKCEACEGRGRVPARQSLYPCMRCLGLGDEPGPKEPVGRPYIHSGADYYCKSDQGELIFAKETIGGKERIIYMKGQPSSNVDHPAHYGGADDPYEAIKVIDAWQLGFSLGNAIKYIARAGKKDPAKHIEDLEKARWYLGYEIDRLKSEAGGRC